MKTIEKLQNPNGPYHKLPCIELEKPVKESNNEALAKWMKEHTRASCNTGEFEEP